MDDNQIILEFIADTSGLQVAAKQMLALGQVTKEQYAAFNKANQENEQRLKAVAKAHQEIDKEVKKNTTSAKAMNDQFRDLTNIIAGEVIKEVISEFSQLGDEVLETAEKSKSLKSQLKELKAELALMEQAGDDSSKKFIEMSVAAAQLEDQIGDTNARIKMLASDTRTFDLVAEGVRGLTAAFSVAQAGAALFGKENEEVQKALLKVQAAMALATGAQELANIATTKGGIATKAYGFAIEAVEVIEKRFAITSAAAWAAATVGVSLLIAGVVSLIYYFSEADDAASEFEAKRTEAANEEVKRQLEKKQELIKALSEADKDFFDQQGVDRKQRLADGEKDNEVEFDLLTKSIEKYQAKVKGYKQGYYDYLNLTAEEEKKRIANFNDYINTALIVRNRIIEKANADRDEQEKKWIERIRKRQIDSEAALQKSIQDLLNPKKALQSLAITDADIDKVVNDINLSTGSKVKILRAIGLSDEDIRKRLVEALQKAAQDVGPKVTEGLSVPIKVKLDVDKEDVKKVYAFLVESAGMISDAIFSNQQEARERDLQKQIEINERKKAAELETKNLTEGQIAAINEKYRRIEAAAKKKAWKADQEAKAEQAIINGLLALTSSLAQQGYPAGLVTGLLALASAGVQAGIILSKPVPEFAAGTKGNAVTPPGFKLVGEKGPELLFDGGGKKVITAPDTAKILAAYQIPAMPVIPDSLKGNNAIGMAMPAGIDVNKLAKAMAKEISASKQTHIAIDKNGLSVYTIENGKKHTSLNTYFTA